jgi:trehalose-6-phosphatase
MKVRPVGVAVFHMNGQTQTDLEQLIAEFRSYVPEAPGVETEHKQVILKFVGVYCGIS